MIPIRFEKQYSKLDFNQAQQMAQNLLQKKPVYQTNIQEEWQILQDNIIPINQQC